MELQLCETTAYRFLERYLLIAKQTNKVFFLAQFLLESALLDSKMAQYPPSLQAAAALYVAMRISMANTNSAETSCWSK